MDPQHLFAAAPPVRGTELPQIRLSYLSKPDFCWLAAVPAVAGAFGNQAWGWTGAAGVGFMPRLTLVVLLPGGGGMEKDEFRELPPGRAWPRDMFDMDENREGLVPSAGLQEGRE